MQTVTIDLSPKVRHYEANGRPMLSDVYFRIDIKAYNRALNDYSEEARQAEVAAVTAFDNEVVELLKKDGWTLRKDSFGPGECPQLKKGAQYLYCHPQEISGLVTKEDVGRMEQLFRSMKSCEYRWTDNYGDVVVTTSAEDERQMYLDLYPAGLATTMKHFLATKRKDLYKDKNQAQRSISDCLAIKNRRADLDEIGTGSYSMRESLWGFVLSEYDRLKGLGYIREAKGAGGRELARWANKAEIREIEKRMKKTA